jgi:glutaminase
VGREAILPASCFGDSIRRNGFDIEEKDRLKIQRMLRLIKSLMLHCGAFAVSDWSRFDPRAVAS